MRGDDRPVRGLSVLQRLQRARSRDPVDGQVPSSLKTAYDLLGLRTVDAVDLDVAAG